MKREEVGERVQVKREERLMRGEKGERRGEEE